MPTTLHDYSHLFTPERMAQGAQGVQAINNMPWVWNHYLPMLQQLLQQQPQAQAQAPVTPAPTPPLQQLIGVDSPQVASPQNPVPGSIWDWQRGAMGDSGGGA